MGQPPPPTLPPETAQIHGWCFASLLGDDLRLGVVGFAVMHRTDEQFDHIDRTAWMIAGMTVLLVVLVMFLVEVASGKGGSPIRRRTSTTRASSWGV